MNVLIDVGHPAHVHLFKNLAKELQEKGHGVFFSAKKDDSITSLLDSYGFDYVLLGRKYSGLFKKYVMTSFHLLKLWRLVVSKRIDVGLGISGLIAFVSGYTKMQSICLDDDDSLATPLFAKSIRHADVILTPTALCHDSRGQNHICYPAYHELAYLHPKRFSPDAEVLKDLGVAENEPYFLLRFNAFRAHHDVGEGGLSIEQKHRLIETLKPHGRVFVSEENESSDFRDYHIDISQEKIHSVIYYAAMFIGDSQTMASEAAILGTPALKCNSFSGRLSIPNEIESDYGLCFSFKPDEFDLLLRKTEDFLNTPDLKSVFQDKRKQLLTEKIDVTAFLVWFVENYPKSKQKIADKPDYQYNFK